MGTKKVIILIAIWIFFSTAHFLLFINAYGHGNVYSPAETHGWWQIISGLTQGQGFYSSIRQQSYLAQHSPLFFWFYALLYRLCPSFPVIAAVHTFLVGTGFFGAFNIARRYFKTFSRQLAVAGLYFFFPLTAFNTYVNFFPLSLLAPFTLLAAGFALNQQRRLLLATSLLVLTIREDAVLSLSIVLLIYLYRRPRDLMVWLILLLGLGYFGYYSHWQSALNPLTSRSVSLDNIRQTFFTLPDLSVYQASDYLSFLPFIFVLFAGRWCIFFLALAGFAVLHGANNGLPLLRLHNNHIFPFLLIGSYMGMRNILAVTRDKKNVFFIACWTVAAISLALAWGQTYPLFQKQHGFDPSRCALPDIPAGSALRCTSYLMPYFLDQRNIFFLESRFDSRDGLPNSYLLGDFSDPQLTPEARYRTAADFLAAIASGNFHPFYHEGSLVGISNAPRQTSTADPTAAAEALMAAGGMQRHDRFFSVDPLITRSSGGAFVVAITAGSLDGELFSIDYQLAGEQPRLLTPQPVAYFSSFVPIISEHTGVRQVRFRCSGGSQAGQEYLCPLYAESSPDTPAIIIAGGQDNYHANSSGPAEIDIRFRGRKRFRIFYFLNDSPAVHYPFFTGEILPYTTAKYCGGVLDYRWPWTIPGELLQTGANTVLLYTLDEDDEPGPSRRFTVTKTTGCCSF